MQVGRAAAGALSATKFDRKEGLKTCPVCSHKVLGFATKVYCSLRCRKDKRNALYIPATPVKSTCLVCEKGFRGRPNKAYCSRKCRQKAKYAASITNADLIKEYQKKWLTKRRKIGYQKISETMRKRSVTTAFEEMDTQPIDLTLAGKGWVQFTNNKIKLSIVNCGCCDATAKVHGTEIERTCSCHEEESCGRCSRCLEHCKCGPSGVIGIVTNKLQFVY